MYKEGVTKLGFVVKFRVKIEATHSSVPLLAQIPPTLNKPISLNSIC